MSDEFPRSRLEAQAAALELNQAARAAEQRRLGDLLASGPGMVLLVSDLHLGRGRQPGGESVASKENFLADDAFRRLLEYWCDRERVARLPAGPRILILNGDVLDFVRHDVAPAHDRLDHPDLLFWTERLTAIGIESDPTELAATIEPVERRYGLKSDPIKSVWKTADIARGHPAFFDALATWVARGGWIVMIRGNHDLELYWLAVRLTLRQELVARGVAVEDARRLLVAADPALRFSNVHIEHGHPFERMTAVEGPDVLAGTLELTYPLGSFINRYLINPLEGIDPFLDNIKPVQDVVIAVLRRYPIRSLGIAIRGWRYVVRALKMRRVLDSLAGLGYVVLVVLPVATLALVVAALACPQVGSWLEATLGAARVPLSAAGVFAPYLAGAVKEFWRDYGPGRRWGFAEKALDRRESDLRALPGRMVYLVTGHTHDQDSRVIARIDGRDIYYVNLGTWAPLWPKDRPDLLGRALRPFVWFEREEDGEYRHRTGDWDDARGEPGPMIILARD